MTKKRRTFSGPEKVAILRRHLVEKIPVSDLCDELGLNPNVFYQWQKKFFENGAAAFERRGNGGLPLSLRERGCAGKKFYTRGRPAISIKRVRR